MSTQLGRHVSTINRQWDLLAICMVTGDIETIEDRCVLGQSMHNIAVKNYVQVTRSIILHGQVFHVILLNDLILVHIVHDQCGSIDNNNQMLFVRLCIADYLSNIFAS